MRKRNNHEKHYKDLMIVNNRTDETEKQLLIEVKPLQKKVFLLFHNNFIEGLNLLRKLLWKV